jgi:hypothetical protein
MRVAEVRINRANLGDTLGSMRSWLDHNDAGSTQFETVRERSGFIIVRVEFATDDLAEAFRRQFSR